MDFCYHCFRELDKPRNGNFGMCGSCGTPFKYLNPFDCLMCGSILAGRFVAGHTRETKFAQSYFAFDWKTRKRVILWEFFPYRHARREVGFPQVFYHDDLLGADGEPAYWLAKYHELETLTAELGSSGFFPEWICSFRENNTAYMVTEDAGGETLEALVNSRGGSIPWLEAMGLLAPAAEALTQIHRLGAIHGALSPEKIVLTGDGAVKLLDSGVYSAWDAYSFAATGAADWKPYHFFSVSCGKPALDVYSLAACFYRAVTGIVPGEPGLYRDAGALPLPEGETKCMPAAMEEVLLDALRVSEDGYSTVRDFWQALEASSRQE